MCLQWRKVERITWAAFSVFNPLRTKRYDTFVVNWTSTLQNVCFIKLRWVWLKMNVPSLFSRLVGKISNIKSPKFFTFWFIDSNKLVSLIFDKKESRRLKVMQPCNFSFIMDTRVKAHFRVDWTNSLYVTIFVGQCPFCQKDLLDKGKQVSYNAAYFTCIGCFPSLLK